MHYIKNIVSTIKVAVLCKYILESELSALNQIDHKFLVSGHSFMSCDQKVIEKNKIFVTIYTFLLTGFVLLKLLESKSHST